MSNVPERFLVAGAGVTGGEVLRQLVATDRKARALVRSPERAESLRKLGVELIEGNFDDWNSWKRALDGVAAVFNIIVTHRDAVRWSDVFLDCAKQSGVRHVVQLSGMSVSPKSPAEFHRQMSQCDEALTASGLSHTILRPNVFYQNMLRFAGSIRERGCFRSAVGDARISMIDVRDVAEVAVPRRRGDRMNYHFAAVHESASGTKRTFNCHPAMSAIGGKADIEISGRDVCF